MPELIRRTPGTPRPVFSRYATQLRHLLLACLVGVACQHAAASEAAHLPVGPLLEGEFALQAGQLRRAAAEYLAAARTTPDPAIAGRAAHIALLAGDHAVARQAIALWRERAPGSAEAEGAQAQLYLQEGEVDQATRQLLALMQRPDKAGGIAALAALGGAGNDRASVSVLERLLASDQVPPVLDLWLGLGALAERFERPVLVTKVVDHLLVTFPDQPRVALLRAAQQRRAGDIAASRATLDAIDPAVGGDADLRSAVADAYAAIADYARAAAVLAGAPASDANVRKRAAMLSRAEDRPALTALYDQLRAAPAPPSAERLLLLGQIAGFLKRYDEALAWFDKVPGEPERADARLGAVTVLADQGRMDEALAATHAIEQDATVPDDARRDAYLLESDLQRRAGHADAELDAMQRGLAAFPDDTALLYNRALIWERRDDIPRAEADFRRILAADPDNAITLNALGYTLADRTDRLDEALRLIDRARAADPDSAAVIDSYGWVLFRVGRTAEALAQLRRAYQLQEDPEIAAHLGEVQWVLGDREAARRAFRASERMAPGNRSLQRAFKRLGLEAVP
jgi:tetratricopeptide (TPR) repeat protein